MEETDLSFCNGQTQASAPLGVSICVGISFMGLKHRAPLGDLVLIWCTSVARMDSLDANCEYWCRC